MKPFYNMINNLDPDLKFVCANPSKYLNFLHISLGIVENNLLFDIYYKPNDSFNYSIYTSWHPPHTKNNISLALAKVIVSIVTIKNTG